MKRMRVEASFNVVQAWWWFDRGESGGRDFGDFMFMNHDAHLESPRQSTWRLMGFMLASS
jgi:hypothetical protein